MQVLGLTCWPWCSPRQGHIAMGLTAHHPPTSGNPPCRLQASGPCGALVGRGCERPGPGGPFPGKRGIQAGRRCSGSGAHARAAPSPGSRRSCAFFLPQGVACSEEHSRGYTGEFCAPGPSRHPSSCHPDVWPGLALSTPSCRWPGSHSLLLTTRCTRLAPLMDTAVPLPIVLMGFWAVSGVAHTNVPLPASRCVSLLPVTPWGEGAWSSWPG